MSSDKKYCYHTVVQDSNVPKGPQCNSAQCYTRSAGYKSEWADTILVAIPKKHDIRKSDNWRGIALLNVVGKVMARILQERLQRLAEKKFSEYQ